MILESQIRQKLSRALNGRGSVWDFADWFNSASWNMHKDSAKGAIDLASSLHHLFAHYDNGLLDENALVQKLKVIASPSIIFVRSFAVSLEPSYAPVKANALSLNLPQVDLKLERRMAFA
jgi:hypothetical protein